MRPRPLLCLAALALALLAAAAPTPAAAAGDDARYALTKGCYALRSEAVGRFAAKGDGERYAATAASVGEAEPLRMQATALGRYLLYGRQGDFLARAAGLPSPAPGGDGGAVAAADEPSESADWRVDVAGPGTFRLTLPEAGRVLTAAPDGTLVAVEASAAEADGPGARFAFAPATGCATFPEVEVNATGRPSRGRTSFGEVRGLLDAHVHMMAFEFLGGRAHCGRPWHPYGVEKALVDCPDHEPGGGGAVLENVQSYGNPARTHDTVGWPTFRDWPAYRSLTHEQLYYRWLERAWRGGLRVYVNLLVDNAVLCELYPYKRNSCNEMDSIRLQARRVRELEDYIDAQEGGPGRGWFRVVRDPFEARRVVNQGKLAVVLGIETSRLFDCRVENDQPRCDRAQIDRQLEEVHALGVRDMELVNKFDNALAGVAGDAGTTGVAVNTGNRYETGRFWQMQRCDETEDHAHDEPQTTAPGSDRDALFGNGLGALLPPGALPVYGAPPHCNARGLTALGEHLVRRMIAKGMIIDPDHLSVRARKEVLSILEAERHSGVISSHSWSTPDALPRILRLGGIVTPYAGDSRRFVEAWRETKAARDPRFLFGIGYGADTNGLGAQGAPRGANAPNPVRYPFRSFDGAVTLDRQRSGQRVYDVNVDGVAHYGLYPDWVEDLRRLAGEGIVEDMARGPEAYLQMWERAVGVPVGRCQPARARLRATGIGRVRLGDTPESLLRRAGQPVRRPGRAWRYCLQVRDGRPAGDVAPVFTQGGRVELVASTGPEHEARGVGRGDRVTRALRSATRAFGPGLRVRRAGRGARFAYAIRRGRVRLVAVASRGAARTPARLRARLRIAGL